MFFPPIEELATADIVSVPVTVTVKEALQRMAEHKVRVIVVEESAGGYGLLTAPDLVQLRLSRPDLDTPIGETARHSLPCIVKGKNILDVLDQFDSTLGYAAVVDASGQLLGIVSNTDILGSLDPQLMLQRQYLRDLLYRHEVKQVDLATPVGKVLGMLAESDDAVIVHDQGKGAGIVTTQDAIRLLQDNVSMSDPVSRHMSAPLHTVPYDLTVGDAVTALREKHFKRLVVVDSQNHDVVGIISQKDLIGVAYSRWADLMRHHALELREIINMLERKTARLEQIAATDPLTGAANRARFEELLDAERQRHSRAPRVPFAVILFDIDHFKRVNDTWGHNQGDLVLKGLVQHVQGRLRRIDTLARWGGEEFAVLLPQTDGADAFLVAEKIRLSLAQIEFGQVGRISASFGVAQYQAGETNAELLGRADNALYRAKRGGRNRVELATPDNGSALPGKGNRAG
jgi:diguanylate cyclase (GGDEF)-like protein